jgi:hypothetical protein
MIGIGALLVLLAGTAAASQPGADAAAREQVEDRETVRRSCRDDAFRLCPAQVALARREAVRRCLHARRDQLSPVCRTAFPEN